MIKTMDKEGTIMYLITKRIIDVLVAGISLMLLSPVFLLIAIAVKADSRGPVFYLQKRVGLNRRIFSIIKFRTMHTGADRRGLLTVGYHDNRITRTGKFLRRFKLDELPQLINVLTGDMSLVGPRPEVEKYVNLYNAEQLKVLEAKPGITDPVSISFFDENDLLAGYDNPEEGYINEVMPEKLRLNLAYINQRNISSDLMILFKTIVRIFS
ncbi:MAG: sugar transferase [Chitinophagales bacterium]|nr:sugar transferase [Chitinophagales bacterium]